VTLEQLKDFLKLDKDVKFEVNKLNRLRASTKKFKDDDEFLKYMKDLFSAKLNIQKKKIKLKKRA